METIDYSDLDDEAKEFFERLFREYYDKLFHYVLKSLSYNNYMVAEDIVQSIYCEAMRKYKRLKNHPNPVGWLMKTGSYKIKAWRRKGSTGEISLDASPMEAGAIDFRLSAAEIRVAVQTVLNDEEQELFERYYVEGYSVREMAEREHMTEAAFKMRIFRIRDRVRKHLGSSI